MEESQDVKEIKELLKKVRKFFKMKIDVKKFVIDKKGEEDLKSKILWGLSIAKRVRMKQIRISKSLYPQLVVFGNDKPITFHPSWTRNND